MKRLHQTITHVLPLLAVGVALQGCGVATLRGPAPVPHGQSANSTIPVLFDGQPATLKNARFSRFALADGASSWTLGAHGPDKHGTVEITCLESAIENHTEYVLDDSPSSESAFLMVRTEKGLLAYSLDASRTSTVSIESVSDGRVTGRFTLSLVSQSAGPGQPHAELVCEHFDVPLVSERGGW